jgi:hypothetical protein
VWLSHRQTPGRFQSSRESQKAPFSLGSPTDGWRRFLSALGNRSWLETMFKCVWKQVFGDGVRVYLEKALECT